MKISIYQQKQLLSASNFGKKPEIGDIVIANYTTQLENAFIAGTVENTDSGYSDIEISSEGIVMELPTEDLLVIDKQDLGSILGFLPDYELSDEEIEALIELGFATRWLDLDESKTNENGLKPILMWSEETDSWTTFAIDLPVALEIADSSDISNAISDSVDEEHDLYVSKIDKKVADFRIILYKHIDTNKHYFVYIGKWVSNVKEALKQMISGLISETENEKIIGNYWVRKALDIRPRVELTNEKDYSKSEREKLAKSGDALSDGSFPIKNKADLKNAIKSQPLSKNPDKAKSFILKKAKELDSEDLLPKTWLKESYSTPQSGTGNGWKISDKQFDALFKFIEGITYSHNPFGKNGYTDEMPLSKFIDWVENKTYIEDDQPGLYGFLNELEYGGTELSEYVQFLVDTIAHNNLIFHPDNSFHDYIDNEGNQLFDNRVADELDEIYDKLLLNLKKVDNGEEDYKYLGVIFAEND